MVNLMNVPCPHVQTLQWCLRFVRVNGVRQRRQTSESIHSGAVSVSTIAEFATTRSFGGNLYPENEHLFKVGDAI